MDNFSFIICRSVSPYQYSLFGFCPKDGCADEVFNCVSIRMFFRKHGEGLAECVQAVALLGGVLGLADAREPADVGQ